jgi:hypothetical protein
MDENFTRRRKFGRAFSILAYFVYSFQVKNTMAWWNMQTKKARLAKMHRAAEVMNRIGRGYLARILARKERAKQEARRQELLRLERLRIERLNEMAKMITRTIRHRIIQMKAWRRRQSELKRMKARIFIRVKLVAQLTVARRKKMEAALVIQCAYRQHLAYRQVRITL